MPLTRGRARAVAPTRSIARRRSNARGRWEKNQSIDRRGRGRDRGVARAWAVADALVAIAADDTSRDALACAFTCVAAYAWVKAFDVAADAGTFASTTSRKLVHVTSGVGFACAWPLFSAAASAKAFACAIPVIQGARLFGIGSGIIKNESAVRAVSRAGGKEELLKGPLYYTAALSALTSGYWRTSPIGIVAIAMMCGGDGFADIVGRRFGEGNALPWNGDKSFAGSAGFVAGGFGIASGLLAYFQHFGFIVTTGSTYAVTFAISCACALVESLPVSSVLDDNFTVVFTAVALGTLLF